MKSSLDRGAWTRFQIDAEVDVFGVGRIVDRYNALREAALEYVTNSYRPEPKYDAERFDKLCDTLGVPRRSDEVR